MCVYVGVYCAIIFALILFLRLALELNISTSAVICDGDLIFHSFWHWLKEAAVTANAVAAADVVVFVVIVAIAVVVVALIYFRINFSH